MTTSTFGFRKKLIYLLQEMFNSKKVSMTNNAEKKDKGDIDDEIDYLFVEKDIKEYNRNDPVSPIKKLYDEYGI